MTSKTLERFDICVCSFDSGQLTQSRADSIGSVEIGVCGRPTSQDMPLQMLISGEGLSTVGTEHHFGNRRSARAVDQKLELRW